MRIVIETIDHEDQRYDTVGDWFYGKPMPPVEPWEAPLLINVSKADDWRSEALIAVHELVEAILCKHAGISQDAVDRWDTGPGAGSLDPGDCPAAPYYKQHKAAEVIERLLALWLFLDWSEHEAGCDKASGA